MKFPREQLLGYLLGALDAAESRQVEAELDQNPALRVEMARYQELLSRLGMDEEPEEFEPPRGLADRTVDFVAENGDAATVASSALTSPVRLSPSGPVQGDSGRNYSFTDILVACSVLLTFGALLFPTINQMRLSAQRATCQYRMVQTGAAIWEYALVQPNRNYPWIPETGNLAVAGNVPLTVRNAGFSLPRQNLLCPGAGPMECMSGSPDPTVEEVEQATGCELRNCQQRIGGDFAYNMGYMSGGHLVASTMGSRENFALMADAPGDLTRPAHDGRGVNVLYEDGHIRFLPKRQTAGVGDDPFHNRKGYSAAGLDPNDSALGPSDARPLPYGDGE
jgi:prepilin-type processing-associated H-X9-DG protein